MSYGSDVNDAEWEVLRGFVERKKRRGPKSRVDLRRVMDGIFYRLRTGCQWRMLPKEFGDWRVISGYWYRWCRTGVWENLNTALRERIRVERGKHPRPTVAIIDAQSVKTAQKGGSAAMTLARKSKAGNAISPSIPSAS